MNPVSLIKTLLPGFLPLVVFIAAEAVYGERVGLAVGVAVGIGEFIYTLVRERRADPFVIGDTVLLVIAGGVSILLENDLFFRLKPAVMEFLLAAGMGSLLVLPSSFLRNYMTRTLRGVQLNEAAMPAMRRSLAMMLAVVVFHAGLTIYAALAMSLAAWGFVSGGLLYILFGFVVLAQLFPAWKARRAARAAGTGEILPLVDEEGKVLGSAPRSECHKGPGKLHPVVHLHIFDSRGRMYLQKRALTKLVEPGKWDTAVGGHVGAGEDLETALARELREELGVGSLALDAGAEKIQALARYKWETAIESELVFTFALRHEGPFAPDPGEVSEARFWEQGEIRAKLGTGLFTPNFEHEYAMFQKAAERKE